jgi:hypothetical protein
MPTGAGGIFCRSSWAWYQFALNLIIRSNPMKVGAFARIFSAVLIQLLEPFARICVNRSRELNI